MSYPKSKEEILIKKSIFEVHILNGIPNQFSMLIYSIDWKTLKQVCHVKIKLNTLTSYLENYLLKPNHKVFKVCEAHEM